MVILEVYEPALLSIKNNDKVLPRANYFQTTQHTPSVLTLSHLRNKNII